MIQLCELPFSNSRTKNECGRLTNEYSEESNGLPKRTVTWQQRFLTWQQCFPLFLQSAEAFLPRRLLLCINMSAHEVDVVTNVHQILVLQAEHILFDCKLVFPHL